MLTRKMDGDTMLFYKDDKMVLSVEETDQDGGILMKLRGELLSECAQPIQDELEALISVGLKVVIDFAGVEYVSAASMNAMLDSQHLADFFRRGELILRGLPDEVYQTIPVSRLRSKEFSSVVLKYMKERRV